MLALVWESDYATVPGMRTVMLGQCSHYVAKTLRAKSVIALLGTMTDKGGSKISLNTQGIHGHRITTTIHRNHMQYPCIRRRGTHPNAPVAH
jgi:hypothetical protein